MDFNNSMQNNTLIDTLHSDIECIQTELNNAYYTINKLQNQLNNKKKNY